MNDSGLIKKNIRAEVLKKRNLLSPRELVLIGERLCTSLTAEDLYFDSELVLAYASYGTEIPTNKFIEQALSDGKQVFLPKVIGKEMIFYRINSMNDLVNGYKGIPEPQCLNRSFQYHKLNDSEKMKSMILMPGVAFDINGNRIGYGGGFYDRFLADKPVLLKRSIAYGLSFQQVEEIPVDEFDLKPSRIVFI